MVLPIQLEILLPPQPEMSDEKLDRLTRELLKEIRQLDVESASLLLQQTPIDGSKSADAVTLGAIALVVLPVVLPKIIDFIQTWSMRASGKTVSIKYSRGNQGAEVIFPSKNTPSTEEIQMFIQKIAEIFEDNQPPA